MLSGGCLCGAVRYEADGPTSDHTVCHCVLCRGATGAPMTAWFSVSSAALKWTAATPTTYRSSEHGERGFCGCCGTQLSFHDDRLHDIDLTAASLDDPDRAAPADHTWIRRKLTWVKLSDGLPQHPEARPTA